ncbi:MAG: hypothetical protein EHM23_06665 [Acidobacteria bacterium]|nr:MAG: hypothetical protein EHM23_06665 [Acidobacteriota bacterium]
MRICSLFFMAALLSTVSVSAQDWYIHPFAGVMQLIGEDHVPMGDDRFHYVSNRLETTSALYGVRAGRQITRRLQLEGGFRFGTGDRYTFALFTEKELSTPQPPLFSAVPLKGGNLFVWDLGLKWNFREKKRVSPFLYGGAGSITRTQAASSDTLLLLDIVARQQNQALVWRDLPAFPRTALHLGFGGGAEISVGRRWGIRFDVRDRFEPNSFPDKGRHFLEITAGPSFRF